ncbi:RNA cytidine acetyltransferase 1-like [Zingiber officinale]|uniref:RNA cytidine acetyltransferase 1-like n=1 Tax=Zingiber officinale TaxID=94328 RepID=UPI001C4DC18F|nr:RNA cytidine acetyltransferase 1-like [Zingiber officinale]
MRKKVDDRIRTLIENGVKLRHRSMLIIVGDKSRDQIVNLHYMLSKAVVKSRPTVLWCYKDKLELSSHKKKRSKQIKKLLQRGLLDPEKVDPFSLFVESGNLTYCLYRDSERILGNTFGMCILQDFEALTPNLLARTIETVEGGGLVILLLRSLSSLTSLYTIVMDVHERFRTESHSHAVARFNERFLLSVASCKACVVMDDELNILPISSHTRSVQPVSIMEDAEGLSERERELKNLKDQFHDDFPVGPLIGKCCTMDQGKAVVTFLDAILDKTLRSTVALIAARGRGKSAALGLAIAGAVAAGYSNIFVTAPSPENLKTLFDFVCKGINALEYKEHLHYTVTKSDEPDLKKSTVKIDIYKQHRQTIQYLRPQDHGKLSQVELLVVDEAAAIPLPVVKSLLGPYLVFLSSTVNGYEGTGRSLSLKLLQQLESQSQMSAQNGDESHTGRLFKKIELHESIRYATGDPIESWLNELLCLDVANYIPNITRLPHPSECDLYYVNRDTLFSYHKESEIFLQRMMALYVASHYKNSPNDLQLMADAPSHHLFVLLGPVDESKNTLPDILCVVQVCLEGQISRKSAIKSLSEGRQPFGDQIPWKFCEQFQDNVFPTLSGVRIVRIAVHPSALRLGYGSTAVELLSRYYEGQLTHFAEEDVEPAEESEVKVTEVAEKVSLLEEKIVPRTNLPPLLVHLRERHPEKLHFMGVSFGLTLDLFRFWRKHNFFPFYIGHIPSPVTGEHTCMLVKPFNNDDIEVNESNEHGFFEPFYQDFRQRFLRLLSTTFQKLDYKLSMSILASKIHFAEHEHDLPISNGCINGLEELLSPHDMKRLEAYTNNCVDYHMILDLLPILARKYFQDKIPVTLSPVQASVLFCLGLQNKDVGDIKEEMKLEREQILSLFIKVMKKFYNYLYKTATKETDETLPRLKIDMAPHSKSVDEELNEAAKEVREKMKAESDVVLDPEYLQQYAIADEEGEFDKALENGTKVSSSGILSVKSNRKWNAHSDHTSDKRDKGKRKGKHGDKSRSNKKKRI